MIGLYMERDMDKFKPCVNQVGLSGMVSSVLGPAGSLIDDFEQISYSRKVLLK